MPRQAPALDNAAVAAVLDEIADLLELKGENVFRAVTYRAAARSIRDLREPLRRHLDLGSLERIPKVGASVSEVITQLLTTGRSERHAALLAAVPAGLLTLLRIPGVGPATARTIHEHLRITTIDELAEAAQAGELRKLPKIQARTEANILRSIASLRQRTGRALLHDARRAASEMLERLRAETGVERIEVAGSLRRWRETIGDIDLLAASPRPRPIMDAFVGAPEVERVLAHGETKSSIVVGRGLQIDLRVVPLESFGAALLYFTGSKEHNVRLRGLAQRRELLLNEYGLFRVGEEHGGRPVASRTEEDIYAALGLDWIAPELREDRGEIDAAAARSLPQLVRVEDIRGDLHLHSDWTDGRDSILEMATAARDRGYEYIALTDHSVGLGMTQGLDVERIRLRTAEIERVNARLAPFRVLIGTEVDIRANGRLDYPDDVLAGFEVVTASVHSAFGQSRETMTKRIVGAIRHPLVDAISHPTGRLLERRDPYAVDLDRLIAAAAASGTPIEVNGGPERLDLPDVHIRRALEQGCRLVTNSDAHSVEELDQMAYAVATARRGWATAASVDNTRPLAEILGRRPAR